MRTKFSNWLKFSVAVMAAVALSSSSYAQDEVATTTDEVVTATDEAVTTTEAPVEPEVKKESARERLVREKRMNTISKTQTPAEGFSTVELFEAMAGSEIKVIIRTKDAANANLIIENTSDKPLAIVMPAAFSAVPVMRQIGGVGGGQGGGFGGGGQGGGIGGGGQQGGGQGVGGGVGGGQQGGGFGGGQQGGGGGGGVFNIPPGRVGKASFKTFCLEEGKPEPRSRIEYRIQPLADLNSDPKIFEMCRMLANGEVTQPIAQAAAWNVANGLSWQELLYKNRIERMDGSYERYFQRNDIHFAQKVVVASEQRAEARAKWLKEQESGSASANASYNYGGESSND